MSEEGWKEFLAAGLRDWCVLHSGAVASFKVKTLDQGAAFIASLSKLSPSDIERLEISMSAHRATIRITRDLWMLGAAHVTLASAISTIASELSLSPDLSTIQEVQVAIAAKPGEIDVDFWRAVLGYSAVASDNAMDPIGNSSTVWMQELRPDKPLKHAMHLDVSVPREYVEQRLRAAISAGGRVVDDSHAPSHWTLSDKAGNRVCVCAWPDGGAYDPKLGVVD